MERIQQDPNQRSGMADALKNTFDLLTKVLDSKTTLDKVFSRTKNVFNPNFFKNKALIKKPGISKSAGQK